MLYPKPGSNKHIRRIHHTERVIKNRADLAYQLGYTTQAVAWSPYKKCNKEEEHRLYRAVGVPCPCEKYSRWSYTKEKNKPTNILADHVSCGCYNCTYEKRKWYGNSKKMWRMQEKKALASFEEQVIFEEQTQDQKVDHDRSCFKQEGISSQQILDTGSCDNRQASDLPSV